MSSTIDKDICNGQSYLFFGQSLSTSGSYQKILSGTGGCDSTVILHLRTVAFFNDSFQQVLCPGSSISFGGQVITAAGVYRDTFSSIGGCDSMVTLTVSMGLSYSNTISQSICEGSSFTFGGQSIISAGLYADTLQTVQGCDSIIILNLRVLPVTKDTIYQQICSGNVFLFGGQVVTSSGIYTETFGNQYGCDSLITLVMNVLPTPTAALETDPNTSAVRVGRMISVINESKGADTVMWTLNGQAVQVVPNAPLPISDTGVYCISLIAATYAGCMDTTERCLTVFDNNLYIPNAFTPNGDGLNDELEIYTSLAGLKYLKMKIYNRWGEKVYQSNDLDFKWDGKI